jgi:hypothetical protein
VAVLRAIGRHADSLTIIIHSSLGGGLVAAATAANATNAAAYANAAANSATDDDAVDATIVPAASVTAS